jgi:hypothetical protein
MAIKESKTIEAQDLNNLKELRDQLNLLTFKRGQLGFAEDNLETEKASLRQELEVLTQKESKLSMDLFEKYGKGEVDLEQGTITPTE